MTQENDNLQLEFNSIPTGYQHCLTAGHHVHTLLFETLYPSSWHLLFLFRFQRSIFLHETLYDQLTQNLLWHTVAQALHDMNSAELNSYNPQAHLYKNIAESIWLCEQFGANECRSIQLYWESLIHMTVQRAVNVNNVFIGSLGFCLGCVGTLWTTYITPSKTVTVAGSQAVAWVHISWGSVSHRAAKSPWWAKPYSVCRDVLMDPITGLSAFIGYGLKPLSWAEDCRVLRASMAWSWA